jgi:hypothetical protein
LLLELSGQVKLNTPRPACSNSEMMTTTKATSK